MQKMKSALIGNTGFVGGNLQLQYEFDDRFNSKNITDMVGKSYDFCVCAGVKAQKWPANQNPDKDWADIQGLIDILKTTNIKRFVLISTVDVYSQTEEADEDTLTQVDKLQPYGYNRYKLEEWVKENYNDYLIIRLPGLFGKNIKKNFIHDMLHPIPALFNELFFNSLKEKMNPEDLELILCYYPKVGINYTWNLIDNAELRNVLEKYNVTSLMFTDSDDVFQYYDLSELRKHIDLCFNNNIRIVNLVTEPVSAKELFFYLFNKNFENSLPRSKQHYNLKTKHDSVFGGINGYISSKYEVLKRIKLFIEDQTK